MSFNNHFPSTNPYPHLLPTIGLFPLEQFRRPRFYVAIDASLRMVLRSVMLNMINDRLKTSVPLQIQPFEIFKFKSKVFLEPQYLTMILPAHLRHLTAAGQPPERPNSRVGSTDSSDIISDDAYFTPKKTLITDILDTSETRHDLAPNKPSYLPDPSKDSTETTHISDPDSPRPNSLDTSEDLEDASSSSLIAIVFLEEKTPNQIAQECQFAVPLISQIHTRHCVAKHGKVRSHSFWAYMRLQMRVLDKQGRMREVREELRCRVVDPEVFPSRLGSVTPGWADVVDCFKEKLLEYGPDSHRFNRPSMKRKRVVRRRKKARDSKGKYKFLKMETKTRNRQRSTEG
ncbi:hypothetical protein B7494_g379 [Chlorociboria aeruginascens]|nr:hypothetical protein B7494_g379 [Chlorociboria aeruginascens]